MAHETEARIQRAAALMAEIDRRATDPAGLERWLAAHKPEIDRANAITVCDKSELDAPVGSIPFKLWNLASVGLGITE
jgi:hypothetical protein